MSAHSATGQPTNIRVQYVHVIPWLVSLSTFQICHLSFVKQTRIEPISNITYKRCSGCNCNLPGTGVHLRRHTVSIRMDISLLRTNRIEFNIGINMILDANNLRLAIYIITLTITHHHCIESRLNNVESSLLIAQ